MPDTAQTGVYTASDAFISRAHVDAAGYAALYAESVSDPEGFWR
ncbi:MAG: acetate--CoA ligase, partial [Pseudomonadota bacterium]